MFIINFDPHKNMGREMYKTVIGQRALKTVSLYYIAFGKVSLKAFRVRADKSGGFSDSQLRAFNAITNCFTNESSDFLIAI